MSGSCCRKPIEKIVKVGSFEAGYQSGFPGADTIDKPARGISAEIIGTGHLIRANVQFEGKEITFLTPGDTERESRLHTGTDFIPHPFAG